ncbi:hypothetical protein IW492_02605 [Enterococcus sp. BWB1-3]|uniref:hypothetical protein n=1 Tax=Enterococcus sp. BWB1-3 TaxID=2787713 RepID=UPI00192286AD|nr:hypothetical protein [Enterococcus sp. BWB1-3]MBL1228122.1 hypothetical protein [Enterococcus sp. BWB1-3]
MSKNIEELGTTAKSIYQAIKGRQMHLIHAIVSRKIDTVDLDSERTFYKNILAIPACANNLKNTGTKFSKSEDFEMTFIEFATVTLESIIKAIEWELKGEPKFSNISFAGIDKKGELSIGLIRFEVEALRKMKDLDYNINFLSSPILVQNRELIEGLNFFGKNNVAPDFVKGNLVRAEDIK